MQWNQLLIVIYMIVIEQSLTSTKTHQRHNAKKYWAFFVNLSPIYDKFLKPPYVLSSAFCFGENKDIHVWIFYESKSCIMYNYFIRGINNPVQIQVLFEQFHALFCSPGVMQFESNRFSVGSFSPFDNACFIFSSASFADLKDESNMVGYENPVISEGTSSYYYFT